jgi:hypothetical protein
MVCLAFFFHTGAAMLTISMTQSHLGSGGECTVDVEKEKKNGLWDEGKGRCRHGHTDVTVTDSETCGCPETIMNRCRCVGGHELFRTKCADEVATDFTVLFGVCGAIVVAVSFGFIILFKKCRNVKIVKIKQAKMRKYRQKAFEEDEAMRQRSSGTRKDSSASSPVTVITTKPDEDAPEEEEVRLAAGHPVWLWSLFILAIVLVTQFITLTSVSGGFLYYHRNHQPIYLYHAGCYDTLVAQ